MGNELSELNLRAVPYIRIIAIKRIKGFILPAFDIVKTLEKYIF